MPVLSNNGRLISSLPVTSTIVGQDELLLQSSGITKRINYATLSGSILSSTNFSPFNATVNFTSPTNKFTGSFYNENNYSCNFYTVAVRDSLSVSNGITGNLTGNVTGNVTGNITSTGTSTFTTIDINGGTIDGTIIGAGTAAAITGTTITANTGFTGNVTGTATGLSGTPNITVGLVTGTTITATTGFTGNVTSTGTSTFSNIDVNGGNIDGTIIGAGTAAAITGTTITATTGFSGNVTGNVTGNLTGNLTGDVYNASSNKILENGSGAATSNGGYPNAFFYGTSSYATQALTAAYAAAGGSAINGIPIAGNQYQILAKNTNTNYDVSWINPITASNQGALNYIAVWDSARTLKNVSNFNYNGGAWNSSVPLIVSDRLTANSITVGESTGGITSSFKGYSQTVTVPTGTGATQYKTISGHKYSSVFLKLSASAYCTMSLMKGQTTSVFVQNSGPFKVLKWSGSLDGGNTASTKIYWKNGLSASITQGDQKKDIITFVNINDKIFGSAVNNFE